MQPIYKASWFDDINAALNLPVEHGRRKAIKLVESWRQHSTQSPSNMVEEKESLAHDYIEDRKETGSHDSNDDGVLLESDKRASAERRLVKKLDHRLLPTIVVIYIMNYIDVRQPYDWIQ
jgi:hypothetical protein